MKSEVGAQDDTHSIVVALQLEVKSEMTPYFTDHSFHVTGLTYRNVVILTAADSDVC